MVFLLALVTSFLLAARSYDPVDYRTPVFALDIVCILMTIWFLCDEIAELKRWIFHKLSIYYYSGTSIYIEVLFHIFFCYWGKENNTEDFVSRIEVRYIEVPLYYFKSLRKWPRDPRQF